MAYKERKNSEYLEQVMIFFAPNFRENYASLVPHFRTKIGFGWFIIRLRISRILHAFLLRYVIFLSMHWFSCHSSHFEVFLEGFVVQFDAKIEIVLDEVTDDSQPPIHIVAVECD